MSTMYTSDVANHPSKMESRIKIAHAIRKTGKHSKVIHYLGGTDRRPLFENHFTGVRNTFIRYEKRFCILPDHYSWARWDGDVLLEKKPSDIGYFVNGDFFEEVWNFLEVFDKQKNYFWLDFCGMPSESLLSSIYDLIHLDCIEDVFITFYLNPRGQKFVSNILSRYSNSLEDRAKSLCEYMREQFEGTHCVTVFDTYNNGPSPMAVIRVSRLELFEL